MWRVRYQKSVCKFGLGKKSQKISFIRRILFDTLFDLFKEKKFSSHRSVNTYRTCYELKVQNASTTQYFEKRFIINRS
jgi:hypothetical protein